MSTQYIISQVGVGDDLGSWVRSSDDPLSAADLPIDIPLDHHLIFSPAQGKFSNVVGGGSGSVEDSLATILGGELKYYVVSVPDMAHSEDAGSQQEQEEEEELLSHSDALVRFHVLETNAPPALRVSQHAVVVEGFQVFDVDAWEGVDRMDVSMGVESGSSTLTLPLLQGEAGASLAGQLDFALVNANSGAGAGTDADTHGSLELSDGYRDANLRFTGKTDAANNALSQFEVVENFMRALTVDV